MLMRNLGHRPPSRSELEQCLSLERDDERDSRGPRHFELPVAVLCRQPLISYSGIVPDAALGVASLLPPSADGPDRWFLLSPTWSLEKPDITRTLRARAVLHRLRRPNDRLIFMCNSPGELELLRGLGEAAFLSVKTCAVSEQIFRPLPGLPKVYSAIYNAQLVDWKRHYLSRDVDRCAFIFYRGSYGGSSAEDERGLIKRRLEHAPDHRFLNDFDADGVPIRMPPDEVNLHLNSAHVGLCLSEIEGAMYASVEYMLAGLAVASTPSTGGRDHFFDDDFCLMVDADADAVWRGVQELMSRRLDPQEIHGRTLDKLRAERARFTQLLNDLCSESGSRERFSNSDLFGHGVLLKWMPHDEAARQAV